MEAIADLRDREVVSDQDVAVLRKKCESERMRLTRNGHLPTGDTAPEGSGIKQNVHELLEEAKAAHEAPLREQLAQRNAKEQDQQLRITELQKELQEVRNQHAQDQHETRSRTVAQLDTLERQLRCVKRMAPPIITLVVFAILFGGTLIGNAGRSASAAPSWFVWTAAAVSALLAIVGGLTPITKKFVLLFQSYLIKRKFRSLGLTTADLDPLKHPIGVAVTSLDSESQGRSGRT